MVGGALETDTETEKNEKTQPTIRPMMLHESHILRKFLGYSDKTSAVVKVSDRRKNICKAMFKLTSGS